jgi:N-acyl-D-aspartate/D-glutamate deacylase
MAFYNFPLKMIKVVQESIDGGNPIMEMERCIWRLTKEQGDWFGIDRGYLAEGKVADLVIIDPDKLGKITEDVHFGVIEEFDNYPRLVNRNEEVVSQVMVNGQLIFEDDEFVEGYGVDKKIGCFVGKTLA